MRTVVGLVVLAISSAAVAADRPPNVVVLFSDDAGFHDFSFQGGEAFPTPRIDSLVRDGVRFACGYVSGCVCSPTRAGLLTGRYQQRFGHETNIPPVFSETNGLPLAERTFADRMKAGGYRTMAVGKWHLGYADGFHPLSRGFDSFYGFLSGARSYFPLEKPGRLDALLRDRDVVPERFEYLTDEFAREAVAQIAAHRERPFFLYVAFNAVHAPDHALPADRAEVRGLEGRRATMAAMTIALDRAVGRVLDGLEEHGLADDTLVVFLNDNGGAAGHDNGELRDRKGSLWEGGVRVPFLMRWPGRIPAGRVVNHPVISLDVLPTALAAAGIAADGAALDGVSLLPVATGKADAPPHETLHWRAMHRWAVRSGDLKLVSEAGAAPALFDLASDPGEARDLAAERPADLARLQRLHDEWNSQLRDPIAWEGPARGRQPAGRPRRRPAAAP